MLNQTFQDFEIIVVDDASEDHTREVVNNLNDKRIKYLVFDWNDPRAVNLFEDKRCESLDIVLKEVKRFSFITPINQWKNRIIICEVQNKTK